MKKSRLLKFISFIFAFVLALSIAACGDTGEREHPDPEVPPAWASDFSLPSGDEAMSRLVEIYGSENKIFLLQNGRIARMPCPENETVTLNMTYEVGDYTKLVLEDSVAEFNEVFAVINPNYKFALNFSPTDEDFAKKYSVRMSVSSSLEVTDTREVFGLAHISYNNNFTELGDFGITIKDEVLDNGSYLMTTFKHELMHLLGAGDAYKNAAATKATVMQSYTVGGYHGFSSSDVAFLDALYRNPSLDMTDEKMREYIDSYEEATTHTRANLTAAVYKKLASSLDKDEVLEAARAIGYGDLSELASTVENGINRDGSFGSVNISFKEIAYAEQQSETYFGSIEPAEKRYFHGRQTSLSSSQGIKYTDYGDGLLYAAPNGNLYTLMFKTGDFVLAFRLHGSFTDLDALSLSLWHISK